MFEDFYLFVIKIIVEGKEVIIKFLFFCWIECEVDFGE